VTVAEVRRLKRAESGDLYMHELTIFAALGDREPSVRTSDVSDAPRFRSRYRQSFPGGPPLPRTARFGEARHLAERAFCS
jgi:hypothetical protein